MDTNTILISQCARNEVKIRNLRLKKEDLESYVKHLRSKNEKLENDLREKKISLESKRKSLSKLVKLLDPLKNKLNGLKIFKKEVEDNLRLERIINDMR